MEKELNSSFFFRYTFANYLVNELFYKNNYSAIIKTNLNTISKLLLLL
jgi:hypothetical protein